jgi:hypothetical protein
VAADFPSALTLFFPHKDFTPMMTQLVFGMALLVGQGEGGELEVGKVRPTYGYLGAPRPRTGILPGDVAHFSFDIKNLKLDANGRAAYSIAIEIRDEKGQLFYEQKPYNSVAHNFFGGNSLPASAHLAVPLDAKPGNYDIKVTVADRNAKTSKAMQGKGRVLPADFGLIRVGTYADAEGRTPISPVGVVGSSLYLNFSAVGFGRDPKTKQPDIQVELRVLDDQGQTTFAKPLTGRVHEDVGEAVRIIPLGFGLTMNRVGNFAVELRARCGICGKSATVRLPVRILDN